jgi:hypothetical protein
MSSSVVVASTGSAVHIQQPTRARSAGSCAHHLVCVHYRYTTAALTAVPLSLAAKVVDGVSYGTCIIGLLAL